MNKDFNLIIIAEQLTEGYLLLLNNFSVHNICQLNSHYKTLLITIYTRNNELSLQ